MKNDSLSTYVTNHPVLKDLRDLLELSDVGIARLQAYDSSILVEAKQILFSKKPKTDKLCAWFMGVCRRLATDYNKPPNWRRSDYLIETLNLDRDQPNSFQKEVYSWPEKTATSIKYTTTTTFCASCNNQTSSCVCGPRSPDIHCVCFKEPNKRCRGFARFEDKAFHPVAAFEHFEKFKNPAGLEYLGYDKDFNPFKQEYIEYKESNIT